MSLAYCGLLNNTQVWRQFICKLIPFDDVTVVRVTGERHDQRRAVRRSRQRHSSVPVRQHQPHQYCLRDVGPATAAQRPRGQIQRGLGRVGNVQE